MTKQELLQRLMVAKLQKPVNQLPDNFENWSLAEILRVQQVISQ